MALAEILIAFAAVALCWLVVFQLLLAAGVPLGHMAWGGADRVLPQAKRWSSLLVAILVAVGAVALTDKLGLTSLLPAALFPSFYWVLTGLFALSAVANLATQSRAEKLHGVPLSVVISAGCLAAALS